MVPGSQWDGFRDASRKRGAQGRVAIDQSISRLQQPECDSLGLGPGLWKVGAQEYGVLKARDRNSVICNAETQSADHLEVSGFEVPWYNWTWGVEGTCWSVGGGWKATPSWDGFWAQNVSAFDPPPLPRQPSRSIFLAMSHTHQHARGCLPFNDGNSKKANVSGCVWFSDRTEAKLVAEAVQLSLDELLSVPCNSSRARVRVSSLPPVWKSNSSSTLTRERNRDMASKFASLDQTVFLSGLTHMFHHT